MLVGFFYAVPNQLPMVARAIEKKKENITVKNQAARDFLQIINQYEKH